MFYLTGNFVAFDNPCFHLVFLRGFVKKQGSGTNSLEAVHMYFEAELPGHFFAENHLYFEAENIQAIFWLVF